MTPELFEVEHFRQFNPSAQTPLLARLEQEAKEEGINIIGPLLARLLYQLTRVTKAQRVLELGTATGYSAIWFGQALRRTGGQLVTMEWDATTAEAARLNIAEAGLSDIVTVFQGDAVKFLEELKGGEQFDLIFNDIDKEMYSETLDPCVSLLAPEGLMVFDNTAFKSGGDFLERSYQHPLLETVHLHGFFPDHEPDFDAVSFMVKK
jgi:caffeoyl-CoA O-methyltransferase